MKRLGALALVLAACADPYVHVIVEGADAELLAQRVNLDVFAYTADASTTFQTPLVKFETGKNRNGEKVPATDFVLTGDITTPVQLRVTVKQDLTRPQFGDLVLDETTGSEVTLKLTDAERDLGMLDAFGRSGDLEVRGSDLATLYGSGVVIAWVNSQGLQLRYDTDADDPAHAGRAKLVDDDAGATAVRLTSRIEQKNYGPKLYAMAWLAGTREPKVCIGDCTDPSTIKSLGAAGASDVRIAAAFEGSSFAVAAAVLNGTQLQLTLLDANGAPIGAPAVLQDAGGQPVSVDAVRGLAVTKDGALLVGWRGAGRSHVWQLDAATLASVEQQDLEGELLAMTLRPDSGRLFTFQARSGNVLVNVVYNTYNGLAPTEPAIVTELGEMVSGGEIGVSPCLVTWPVRRSNTLDEIDLHFAVLDTDGARKANPSRLVNASEDFDHVRPTSLCGSETRAYAVFLEQPRRDAPEGSLMLRHIPTPSETIQ